MVTPEEIRKKALSKYLSFLKYEFISKEEEFFPLVIRCDKSIDFVSLKELEQGITCLYSFSKEKKGYGYEVEYVERNTKLFGKQSVPSKVSFVTKSDFLRFIGMDKHAETFRSVMEITLQEFPELRETLVKHHSLAVEYHDEWEQVMKVCRFFRLNPKPGKFVRELNIGVHTKFVEESRDILRPLLDVIVGEIVNTEAKTFFGRFNLKEGDPEVAFRITDPELCSRYMSGFTYNKVFVCEFARFNIPVRNVIIVENRHNMTKVIELIPEMKDTLVVWGCGYKATVLKDVAWLNDVNLYYWGDIDAQGYEIMANVRKYFPHMVSIMMDSEALAVHPVCVKGKNSKIKKTLELLGDENEIYNFVKEGGLRFEQELLPEHYVESCLTKLI